MAINVSQAFKRTSANPIDETLTLTKAQMLTVNDNLMPNKYLTVCQDDGAIYLYDKSATPSVETGKFTKFEGGGGQGGGGITIDATLLASGWDSSTKQQTVAFSGYETSMGGVIGMPTSATSAQKEAYANAKINVVSQSGASFTFECDEIPSVDLPVTLYAGGSGGGGGADLPSGGTTGQALVKASDADNDVEWGDVSGEQIQYEEMPQADITNLGQIVQYIGTTDTDYTNGLFYECVSDGEATPTYSWAEKLVQNTDVDLANVFASGLPISSADKRPFAYSTEEQIVGSWIDGKPIYQKTYSISNPSQNVWATIGGSLQNCILTNIYGSLIASSGLAIKVPYYSSDNFNVQMNKKVDSDGGELTYFINLSGQTPTLLNITIQYTKTTD